MDNLNDIEKRIIEKQKQFHKISLKRQKRLKTISKKISTKNSYAQTDDFVKKIIKLEISDNNVEDIKIIEKIYSDKNVQCSIGYPVSIINDTTYLIKFFENIADIKIIDIDTNEKSLKKKYLYKINPYLFDIKSNFNDNLNLVFFNDFEMLLQIDIIINGNVKYLILYNQKKIIIGKYTVKLKLNQEINLHINNKKFYFNNNSIFNFKKEPKYFYSSSNLFIKKS
jgi:hypothetical protein